MNSVGIYYYSLFFACYCRSVVKALPLNGKSTTVKVKNNCEAKNASNALRVTLTKDENSMKMISRNELQIHSTTLSNIERINNVDVTPNIISKFRVKRQSGAGKFVEAAEMPPIKLVRLFLQMFKNLWDAAYVGGTHPFHPNVPKTVMQLYKQKIVEFFIPDIEAPKGN